MVRRIHIIGAPGSGKSTVANWLSRDLGIPSFELDTVCWEAPGIHRKLIEASRRDAKLAEIVSHERWIVEGAYVGAWLESSFKQADLIVLMDAPPIVRHWRVIRRFLSRPVALMRVPEDWGPWARLLGTVLRYSQRYADVQMPELQSRLNAAGKHFLVCRTYQEVLGLATCDTP